MEPMLTHLTNPSKVTKERPRAKSNNRSGSIPPENQQLHILTELIQRLHAGTSKAEYIHKTRSKSPRTLPEILGTSITISGQNLTGSPYGRDESSTRRPHRPTESKPQAFQRKHPAARSKTPVRHQPTTKKRPILRLEVERIKRGRTIETNFQKHLRNVVKSIEKRNRGSISPFSVGRSTHRSVSESSGNHISGSATSRTIHEEIRVKRNLAKILKSTNLISFIQDKKSLEEYERSYPSARPLPGLDRFKDTTKKSLIKTFSLKTDRPLPKPQTDDEVEPSYRETARSEILPPPYHKRSMDIPMSIIERSEQAERHENPPVLPASHYKRRTEVPTNIVEELEQAEQHENLPSSSPPLIIEPSLQYQDSVIEPVTVQRSKSIIEVDAGERITDLKMLPFFQNYLPSKYFNKWKENALTLSYNRKREKLAKSFAFVHPIFSIGYNDIMSSTHSLESIKFLSFPTDPSSDLETHFHEQTALASEKAQTAIETIKQVTEESQILIQEIQESVDEYRADSQRRRANRSIKDDRVLLAHANSIDQRIQHLISLLNSYKGFVKAKLEDAVTRMGLSNLLPAYENLVGNVQTLTPTISVGVRVVVKEGERRIGLLPDLASVVDSLKDSFENSFQKIVDTESLIALSQLLIPLEAYGISPNIISSLCNFRLLPDFYVDETAMMRIEQYPGFKAAKEIFHYKIRKGVQSADEYLSNLKNNYEQILSNFDTLDKVSETEQILDFVQIKSYLKVIGDDAVRVKGYAPSTKIFGCFLIDDSTLKADLQGIAKQVYPKVRDTLGKVYRNLLEKMASEAQGFQEHLSLDKEDIKHYDSALRVIQSLRPNNMDMTSQLEMAQGVYNEFFNNKANTDISNQLSHTKKCVE